MAAKQRLGDRIIAAAAAYKAMPSVDQALIMDDQRRSLVRSGTGRDPGPSVLADEVRRLRNTVELLNGLNGKEPDHKTIEQGLDEAALAEVREKAFALTLPGPTAEFYADLAEAAVRRYVGLTALPAPKGRDELLDAAAVTKACEAYEAETLNWSQESAIGNAIRAYLAALPAPKGRDELKTWSQWREWLSVQVDKISNADRYEVTSALLDAAARTIDDAILSLLPETGQGGGWRPTHRHVKRGTDYRVIGQAEIQVANIQPREGDVLTVYEGQDGKLWARECHEFNDGRFEPLPAPPEGSVS